jgi:hypothetical protein
MGYDSVKTLLEQIAEFRGHSDLVVGIDLVDHEDLSHPLLQFVPEILKNLKNGGGDHMHFYMTSGESHNRQNKNIVEAILLNSKRISQGIQLLSHPHLV